MRTFADVVNVLQERSKASIRTHHAPAVLEHCTIGMNSVAVLLFTDTVCSMLANSHTRR